MDEKTPEASSLNMAGGTLPFAVHPLRDTVVAEVHARPVRPIETPRVLHHMAFLASDSPDAETEALNRFCAAQGALPAAPDTRHHVVALGGAELRWEKHTEFTTMTLSVAPPPGDPFIAPKPSSIAAFLPKPVGQLLVATRLAIIPAQADGPDLSRFDPSSLCVSSVDGGNATIATDFRPDGSGFTRFLVEDRSLSPVRAGALVQRLLEIETYRTLALLGLPEAQRVTPVVNRVEADLSDLTARMRESTGYQSSRDLLDRLASRATEIESEAATVGYRFSATRAYEEIVSQRLASIRETRVPGYSTIESFLGRRMRPAMRTCEAVENRLQDLAQKVARTSNLLRTRVDIELESQNRDLLKSMNRRARLQLRLQRTVEGLSVAAITYYVVGLVGHLARAGREAFDWPVEPVYAMGVAVPITALVVWAIVRRIRRHADDP